MDMEHELHALRIQLAEKSKHSLQLQKEVFMQYYCVPKQMDSGMLILWKLVNKKYKAL